MIHDLRHITSLLYVFVGVGFGLCITLCVSYLDTLFHCVLLIIDDYHFYFQNFCVVINDYHFYCQDLI